MQVSQFPALIETALGPIVLDLPHGTDSRDGTTTGDPPVRGMLMTWKVCAHPRSEYYVVDRNGDWRMVYRGHMDQGRELSRTTINLEMLGVFAKNLLATMDYRHTYIRIINLATREQVGHVSTPWEGIPRLYGIQYDLVLGIEHKRGAAAEIMDFRANRYLMDTQVVGAHFVDVLPGGTLSLLYVPYEGMQVFNSETHANADYTLALHDFQNRLIKDGDWFQRLEDVKGRFPYYLLRFVGGAVELAKLYAAKEDKVLTFVLIPHPGEESFTWDYEVLDSSHGDYSVIVFNPLDTQWKPLIDPYSMADTMRV